MVERVKIAEKALRVMTKEYYTKHSSESEPEMVYWWYILMTCDTGSNMPETKPTASLQMYFQISQDPIRNLSAITPCDSEN